MNKLITILFGSILALSLFTQLLPDREFSDQENRYLQTMPNLTWSTLVTGQYTSKLEAYIQDHFFSRDVWMKGKTHLEELIGKNQTNGVYPIEDGKYLEVDEGVDESLLQNNIAYLENLVAWLESQNIPSDFLAIYSSYEFYRDQLPKYNLNYNQREVTEKLLQLDDLSVIDTYTKMLANNNKHIYFDTDHHWTQLGAYFAYEEIAKQKSWDIMPIEAYIEKIAETPFFGTLYSKAPRFGVPGDAFAYYIDPYNAYTLTISETGYTQDGLYKEEELQNKDKYVTFLGGNNGLVVIERNSYTQDVGISHDNPRTLMIFKDSYSHALVPFLAQHYEKVVMVDMRYYSGNVRELVTEVNPSEVMFAYNVSWFAKDNNLNKWNRK